MNCKIALLSDIHGNMTALESAIEDAKQEKITDYWFLGDLLMPGPGSDDLLNKIRSLPNGVFVRGNWEDCFFKILNKEVDLNDPTDIFLAKQVQYHYKHLNVETIDFIKEMPMHLIKQVNGLKFSLCHHLPNKNYGGELFMTKNQKSFDLLFKGFESDIAIYGHSHHPIMRYSSEEQLILNPGSIGQPFIKWPKLRSDLRAQYGILEVDSQGFVEVKFKKISYDIHLEFERAKKRNVPYLELYQELLETGKTYTRNTELLRKINEKYNYKDEVREFIKEFV